MPSEDGASGEADGRSTVDVPAFREGGLVQSDGLALVHKDEVIVPADQARAEIQPVELAGGDTIHLSFGIEVVFVGAIPEEDKVALEDRIWLSFESAIG
jgi:hypothetical protein